MILQSQEKGIAVREQLEQATGHLAASDPVMAYMVKQVGPCTLRLERNAFRMLVRSIIGQQLSSKAARTIRVRFEGLVGAKQFTPEAVVSKSLDDLRAVGISSSKSRFILALASGVVSGEISFNTLGRMTDDDAIARLTQIKGVGRWTAHMFLIFSLGRLDVLPCDDAGVRSAIRRFYKLESLPCTEEMIEIAAPWRPYASVASWYCWQCLDNQIEVD